MGAYNKIYLENVKHNFGAMLDCGINVLGFDNKTFYNMFLASTISGKINRGDCYNVCTLGGVELAELVVNQAMNNTKYVHVKKAADPSFNERLDNAIVHVNSPEYWAGTIIAEYAWEKNISYQELNKYVSIDDFVSLYDSFGNVDSMMIRIQLDEMFDKAKEVSNLKSRRELMELSQKELAEASDVPLRTIQQYEQRQKNINNAKVSYLISLSSVLKCDVRDIME